MTYAEVGEQAARLAHALRALGVTGDERVGTFMWNNAEHLVAYLAVPTMGAVLHTLNIRLFPEQLAYIANHAEDRVVIVDALAHRPAGRRCCRELDTVQHVIVVGRRRLAPLDGLPADRCSATTSCWPGRPELRLAGGGRDVDAAAMCYTSGTTGNPKGVVYSHRSIYLHSMQVCIAEALRAQRRTTRCWRSCRCSTRLRGACRTRRSCPARRW